MACNSTIGQKDNKLQFELFLSEEGSDYNFILKIIFLLPPSTQGNRT